LKNNNNNISKMATFNQKKSIPDPFLGWPILMKSCTCGNRLGYRQKEIEQNIIKKQNENPNMNLREARVEVLKEMGFLRTCCIKNIVLCPKIIINDADGDSYNDTTKKDGEKYINNRTTNDIQKVGWGFLPDKRNIPQFNEEQYLLKLQKTVFGNTYLEKNQQIFFSKFDSNAKSLYYLD
jgi:DNA-directed RNA polymerase subunit N (RpoN/RPB10)